MGAMDVTVTEEVATDDSKSESSLAFLESLTMPPVQEVVISADVGCTECQKRITSVISRFNEEMESVVVNLSDKKVIVTCKYLTVAAPSQISTCPRRVFRKVPLFKRMLGSSKP